VNFARPDEHGPFSDADLLAARHSSEQVALAVDRGLRFELTGKRANVLEHALDRVPQPLVITDLSAEVIFRNRAALAADRAGEGRPAARSGTNRAPGDRAGGASVREAVEGSIAEAMTEFRRDGKRVSTRSVRSQGQQMIVRSYRLPEQDHAAVTIVYPYQDGSARRLPVWEVLTPREQEIAQLISHGLTTRQIAERAFVSENTVKQHLKRVFAKTDVRNRAELMQRIWSSGDRADGGAQPDR
jgi:DNA-binding CsgD family transcriptional regulator